LDLNYRHAGYMALPSSRIGDRRTVSELFSIT
jgi:hypothetical protein